MHQFFVSSKRGDVVRITGEDAHHIIRVLRLKTGEEIFIVVGRGERFKGEIWKFKDGEVLVKLKERVNTRFEPNISLSIAQSLPKGRKFEEVIKTCTELGVIEFFPIISERTVVKVREEKVNRWRRIAKEEAMLSKRDIIPEVHDVSRFEDFIRENADRFEDKLLFWELERERFLRDVKVKESVIALIGNEGGWSQKEVEMAQKYGFITVGLGNRILRAEVAPVVISSLILFKSGDLG